MRIEDTDQAAMRQGLVNEAGIVLGFYQDPTAAGRILQELRHERFRHSAAVQKTRDGRVSVKNSDISPPQGALLGGSMGLLVGFWAGLTPLPLALITLSCLSLGALAAWWYGHGVDERMLGHFKRWVVLGESLALVQVPAHQMGRVLSILRRAGDGTATFGFRSERILDRQKAAEPLRKEAVNPERLSAHAARIAADLELAPDGTGARPLLPRLRRTQRLIESVRRSLADAVLLEQGLTAGAEWLLDNSYLIQGQIAEVRHNLPQDYYRELPVAASGPLSGFPRLYGLALELIAHTDARLDRESIVGFLRAYQSISPLRIGELWAIPLMLRYGLFESLLRLSIRVYRRQQEHGQADFWANRLLNASRCDPDQLLFILAELAHEQPRPSAHMAVRLVSHLHDEPAPLAPLQGWLERKLDVPLSEVLQQEQNRQAADQVSIANAVNSLRYLTRLQWQEVMEEVSLSEAALREDPAGVYPEMDFGTRDRYRHAVEEIARWSGGDEVAVARRAVSLARAGGQDIRGHVGYYLVGTGRAILERHLDCHTPFGRRAARWSQRRPACAYLGSLAVFTVGVVAVALALAAAAGAGPGILVPLGALAILPASELAIQVVNRVAAHLFPPAALPRMSFAEGIPEPWRTLVIVPMMLLAPDAIRDEVRRLEVRYLANPDPRLHFALLADFADAPAPGMPEDDELLRLAGDGIRDLNARYGAERFFLFHRRRRWSPSEERWIGWERKRGKIEELNQLLDDAPNPENDLLHVGKRDLLRSIRFVITLDSDTQLPRDTARHLVETLAHPLNQPQLATDGRTVAAGYSIIQPRVCTSLPSATASRFTRLFADPTGSDPYCHAISDVYQDLAGEGIFYGKGIYDPRAFHRVLAGRFPEATILSHDLLEGAYLRVGLASDIVLLDLFPLSYQAHAKRLHRWIRGDWQIADWILPRVPVAGGQREPNPLSPLNRWKILDNLRRSLVPGVSICLLVAGWLWSPSPFVWSLLVGCQMFLPAIAGLLNPAWRELLTCLARNAACVSLLPHQAGLTLDAISRVWYRRLISRRRLLEWETAQATHWRYRSSDGGRRMAAQMSLVTALAAALALLLGLVRPAAVPAAAPFLILWAISPLVVWWLNCGPAHPAVQALATEDRRTLREIARRTWRYFDEFVDQANHWLPPDNYQEALHTEIARRTSPTNIGMWLLSALSAYDLGYLTIVQLADRTGSTMETIARLERYEGHLLNWYNTETLEPLRPRYVSTVDSGNLLASLWTFAVGLRRLATEPALGPQSLHGLRDTLAVIGRIPAPETSPRADRAIASLTALFAEPPADLEAIHARILQAAEPARELVQALAGKGPAGQERSLWAERLEQEIRAWATIAAEYLSWVTVLSAAPEQALDGEVRAACHQGLTELPSLAALAAGDLPWLEAIRTIITQASTPSTPVDSWWEELLAGLAQAKAAADRLLIRLRSLEAAANELALSIKMDFLYDPERRLFAVGYNVSERRLDTSYYDLLASEARLASFMAIAQGDVPSNHWLALGRPFSTTAGRLALLSWNGTMFEYLMPLLLHRSFSNSLLDQACKMAVSSQIAYGRRRGIPWGISEAAFSALDSHQIYQYRAFGVPGLGLKRGLEEDVVVAPYASALSLSIDPRAATENLKRLAALGLLGSYGFFEALDYTRERCPEGERGVVIYAFMAHHQGMTLVSINNALNGGIMPARFHADPRVRATEPLLFERIPTEPPTTPVPGGEGPPPRLVPIVAAPAAGHLTTANTPTPKTCLLSNGVFSVMVTNAGGGYSRWRDIDLTRWRADTTRDAWGEFCFIRDLREGAVWSAAYHPLGHPGRRYTVDFTVDRAEFRRRDVGIETLTEIVVSPEDDAEVRRLTLTNLSGQTRHLELTSYAELALAPHGADRAHPAFSKLFVETEALPAQNALLAWRRPRAPEDPSLWAAHVVALEAPSREPLQYETDRARFLGRGRNARDPAALEGSLTNTVGMVLDPVFSLRCRISIAPGQRFRVAFVTLAAESRAAAIALAEKYRELSAANTAIELAWTHAQLELRHFGIQTEEARHFQELGSHALYPNTRLRPAGDRLRRNTLGQTRLWAYGISGDLPIIAVTVDDAREINMVREVLLAHTYLRIKGLKTDLVILNGEAASYGQPLQEELRRLTAAHMLHAGIDQPGGVFLRAVNQMPEEDLTLLLATARIVLVAARGSLAQQLATPVETGELPPRLRISRRPAEEPSPPLPFMELPYFNGLGGFTFDGREYAIYLGPGNRTPAPWVNVMSNPDFGALVSEAGSGLVWSGNSQNNRLTPWSNDPVSDPASGAIYLRDEETGVIWTPTLLPLREQDAYRARHGQGYTVFEHNSHAIEQEMTVFVPMDDGGGAQVRIERLRLRNRSGRRRQLTVTAYADWTLGSDREETQLHVVTKWDAQSRALLARNAYHPDYDKHVAFAALSPAADTYTADRMEFLGRNGSPCRPAALDRRYLSGRTGAGLDACTAQQVMVEIEPGKAAEVIVLTGQAADVGQVRQLVRGYRDPFLVEEALNATRGWWDELLGTVQVKTPVLSVDIMLNRWLLYQTLSCRIWGRSALYQSGGAFGFRDQLQDVMALLHAAPNMAREHILHAAGRQFVEGDVQHWWHPPAGGGTRTRCSDDLLWLVYATAYYVKVTGDTGILEVRVPFLDGRLLEEGEQEIYLVPSLSMEDGSLFEHCRRAVERGLTAGPHGLPLIGAGDWNDGLNRVGHGGRGESIWLAWFILDVLRGFAGLCELAGESELARSYRDRLADLAQTVEAQAWDGSWYRRAYFDDGTPLGSRENLEARLDSIAQSWAVLSDAGDPSRSRQALLAAEENLVRWADRLAVIFAPPFECSSLDPGYIKGYPPGARENGGQYTHAAVWLAMAFAHQGDGDRAVALLQLLNPIERARTPADVERYRVEPYAVAADVHAHPDRLGQGGWTWYTGSSGWMYRVWLEEVLGVKRQGGKLRIEPAIPADWTGYSIQYRLGGTIYEILAENPDRVSHGVALVELDGERLADQTVMLNDDGGRHIIRVVLGPVRETSQPAEELPVGAAGLH